MADLIAQGPRPEDRWRQPLPAGQVVLLGRQQAPGAAGSNPTVDANGTPLWGVPWEPFLSRRHVELVWRNGRLEVRQLPQARNPLYLHGRETDHFELKPGEHFVVGSTVFMLVEQGGTPRSVSQASTAADPGAEQPLFETTISAPELHRQRFRDAPHRLDVLRRLPDVISGAADDQELFLRLENMLLAGIPTADVVALVKVKKPESADRSSPAPDVEVLHWERRLATGDDFYPSNRLVQAALHERHQTVLRVWRGSLAGAQDVTVMSNCDWAFCTPILARQGEHKTVQPVDGSAPAEPAADLADSSASGSGAGVPVSPSVEWGIYVAGRFGPADAETLQAPLASSELGDDLKFTELVAAVLHSLQEVRSLQRRQASLSQFFSPTVLGTLTNRDPDLALQPREADLTILFCDLRGFSRAAERHADNLLALLNRVSQALGVMTQNILDQKGVIGDFHGDAAMGFWGWPLPQPDRVERACLAALGIRTFFEAIGHKPGHPLAGFQVGIGIASGRAVAGKIGTVNQVKVTVFGPVVNLASRLEGMTKLVRAPILLDETTAQAVQERGLRHLGRLRRVAKLKPYGLDTPLVVSELLPPLSEYPELTDAHLADYEKAVDALLAGSWSKAYDLLRRMPPEDRVPDFLTVLIAKHDRRPPPGWNGVIELDSKS
jgi:adenylate cyclase